MKGLRREGKREGREGRDRERRQVEKKEEDNSQ